MITGISGVAGVCAVSVISGVTDAVSESAVCGSFAGLLQALKTSAAASRTAARWFLRFIGHILSFGIALTADTSISNDCGSCVNKM